MADETDTTDPAKRNPNIDQPTPRPVRRRSWLIPATVIAGVAIGVFVNTLQLNVTVPAIGILTVLGFYIAMLVVAGTMRTAGTRNRTLGILLLLMSLAALGIGFVLVMVAS